ncbi:putative flavin-containing amine oxidasedehydrogenase [Aspergillus candidus]|uniref:Putative flavin-containing amine oxidasedehydrogenase n=1 Tax=Aspergillus candidus TaxID=41067 RepID=A0A2I2EZS0_ASPCN|nr:putative flavin-containing amine oxidasedehydrogenase [Aspergillus candidus]PLB33860.1 putative flavin-containing amine oxidasedehydrogenase [Aspergillus candidus]
MSSVGQPKKVAIIGAGAAGMSCASTLAQHPDKFDVTLFDIATYTGGQATSIDLDSGRYGANWMNDGVQGGSGIFHHTFNFFRRYGYEPRAVQLQVAFGKGPESFFTNIFPSPLIDQFSHEIKKLGRMLSWIKRLMPVLGILPLKTTMRLFRFSRDFSNRIVLPLIALFLGTGNQTPNVPSALLERLFDDPNMKLWDYDPDALLPNQPTMYTFPNLSNFYSDWTKDLASRGVHIRLNTRVQLLKRDKYEVILRPLRTRSYSIASGDDMYSPPESFDDLVLCCPADEAKRILDEHASWRERYVLNGVSFYNDLTVTHSDASYFANNFETRFRTELCGYTSTEARKDQAAFARQQPPLSRKDGWEGFAPMYFTHSLPSAPDRIEMGFDCSHYQHQFREALGEDTPAPEPDRHVYQSIFLNDEESHLWTLDGIDENKIIARKWWHQFGHRWQHYLRVVPGMMFINGKNRTLYAGSWTMVNMHEIAVISGIAAAYRLGAEYRPFDEFAEDCFKKYLLLSHGTRYERRR